PTPVGSGTTNLGNWTQSLPARPVDGAMWRLDRSVGILAAKIPAAGPFDALLVNYTHMIRQAEAVPDDEVQYLDVRIVSAPRPWLDTGGNSILLKRYALVPGFDQPIGAPEVAGLAWADERLAVPSTSLPGVAAAAAAGEAWLVFRTYAADSPELDSVVADPNPGHILPSLRDAPTDSVWLIDAIDVVARSAGEATFRRILATDGRDDPPAAGAFEATEPFSDTGLTLSEISVGNVSRLLPVAWDPDPAVQLDRVEVGVRYCGTYYASIMLDARTAPQPETGRLSDPAYAPEYYARLVEYLHLNADPDVVVPVLLVGNVTDATVRYLSDLAAGLPDAVAGGVTVGSVDVNGVAGRVLLLPSAAASYVSYLRTDNGEPPAGTGWAADFVASLPANLGSDGWRNDKLGRTVKLKDNTTRFFQNVSEIAGTSNVTNVTMNQVNDVWNLTNFTLGNDTPALGPLVTHPTRGWLQRFIVREATEDELKMELNAFLNRTEARNATLVAEAQRIKGENEAVKVDEQRFLAWINGPTNGTDADPRFLQNLTKNATALKDFLAAIVPADPLARVGEELECVQNRATTDNRTFERVLLDGDDGRESENAPWNLAAEIGRTAGETASWRSTDVAALTFRDFTDARLESPVVDLASSDGPVLDFYHAYDIPGGGAHGLPTLHAVGVVEAATCSATLAECVASPNDPARWTPFVRIVPDGGYPGPERTPGGTARVLYAADLGFSGTSPGFVVDPATGPRPAFSRVRVPLSDQRTPDDEPLELAGKRVRFAFRLVTQEILDPSGPVGAHRSHEGWYLADVKVLATASVANDLAATALSVGAPETPEGRILGPGTPVALSTTIENRGAFPQESYAARFVVEADDALVEV
ncbi:MAG: hypothetical protein ACT4PT_03210, partial [Methanobacteriota archaeon]